MPYTPVTVERFNGLNVAGDPGEVGWAAATDGLNFDLAADLSQVRSRGGMSLLGATGAADPYHRIVGGLDGIRIVCAKSTSAGLILKYCTISSGAFGADSAAFDSATSVTTSMIVAEANSVLVASADGSTNNSARQWTGSSLINLGHSPRYFARWQDRVVAAHYSSAAATPSGANGSTSTVFFSVAGDLDGATFNAADWIKVGADDGEDITGVVEWNSLLFVLKRSALYIFYGISVDSTGGAIFNYRKVPLSSRARASSTRGGENIIAAGDGVYLLLADGLWRTTGGPPQYVSRSVAPIFNGTAGSSLIFPSSGNWSIGYALNRVYLSYLVGGNYRTLVYDTTLGQFLFWDITVGNGDLPTNVTEWVNASEFPTAYVMSDRDLLYLTSTGTTDNAVAIASSYRTGFRSLADGKTTTLRRFELTGYGTLTHTLYGDHSTAAEWQGTAATSVTMGTSPAIARAYALQSGRCRDLAVKWSATSGAWALNRWTGLISAVRSY